MPIKRNEFFAQLALFRKAFGDYAWVLALLSALSLASGFLESIGINAVIPLFSFLSKGGAPSDDFISHGIAKLFAYAHVLYTLKTLLLLIIILFLIKAAVLFCATYLSTRISVSFETRMRNRLFGATLNARWTFLAAQKIGHLDQILTTDIDQSSKLLTYLSTSIIIFANIVAYGFLVVNISWVVAALTVLFGLLVLFSLRPLFLSNTKVSEAIGRTYKALAHHVNEHVVGMKFVKSAGVERSVLEKSSGYFDDLKRFNLKMTVLRNATTVLLQPVGLIFVVVLFVFFYKMTVFNFASFAVVVYAINKIFAFVQQAQSNLHTIYAQAPYLASVLAYLEETKRQEEDAGGEEPFRFKETFSFDDVSFSYADRDKRALEHVSFTLQKGEMTGLIGPSGAGKTTLVDLMLRLYLPESGKLLLDGRDVRAVGLAAWRESIGYVSQEIFLLNDTIENNIRFYGTGVTDADVREAARLANLYDLVESLPNKWQTLVGERGTLLSAGQRQRVILARVLARHPQMLVLDEATSALDNESELAIQKAVEGLKGKVTVLAIAHRLSTVKASDRLIVLKDGKVVESGKPDELLKDKDSYFFKVYHLRN